MDATYMKVCAYGQQIAEDDIDDDDFYILPPWMFAQGPSLTIKLVVFSLCL